MDFKFTNFSIVVLAKANNPSILNPDFLKINKIVDSNYKVKDFICTPPVAQVSFDEGISIITEFERLQFIDNIQKRIPCDSQIPKVAVKYIETLPHVNYIAAGINFVGHYQFEDNTLANSFITGKFIKEGSWLSQGDGSTYVCLKFIYSFGKIKCTISIDSAEINKADGEIVPVIVVHANYNLDVKGNNIAEIKKFISDWRIQHEQFVSFLKKTFF
ncbi:MAG: hypothetical protein FJ264_15035 [Planctomycetes bacterium]|nr:hypothetical protein [Planctomycetota bacterium]